jgi:hypothetical protein
VLLGKCPVTELDPEALGEVIELRTSWAKSKIRCLNSSLEIKIIITCKKM